MRATFLRCPVATNYRDLLDRRGGWRYDTNMDDMLEIDWTRLIGIEEATRVIDYATRKTEDTTLRFLIYRIACYEIAIMVQAGIAFQEIERFSRESEPICPTRGRSEITTLRDWLELVVRDAVRMLDRNTDETQEGRVYRALALRLLEELSTTIEKEYGKLATKIRWTLQDERKKGATLPAYLHIPHLLGDENHGWKPVLTQDEETDLALKYIAAYELCTPIIAKEKASTLDYLRALTYEQDGDAQSPVEIVERFFGEEGFIRSLNPSPDIGEDDTTVADFWNERNDNFIFSIAQPMAPDMFDMLKPGPTRESFKFWSRYGR